MIINRLTDLLGENTTSILDLPAMYNEIATATRVKLRDDFASMGLLLKQLYILSVSPTPETSAAIDEAASMGAIGDMDRYLKFKAARAVGDAATTETSAGATQTGLGLGTGLAAAQIMASTLAGGAQPAAGQQQDAQPQAVDPVAALKTLKELFDQGLISQDEYNTKRQEILSRL
jgi:membrane protease subunit (stomatin/prohibitin family)